MKRLAIFGLFAALAITARPAAAAEPTAAELQRTYEQTVARGIAYLRSRGQADDGSFSKHTGPGVTALVTTSLLLNGVPPEDPQVAKSLTYLEGFIQPDGGIHQKGTLYRNYETCLAILCFKQANRKGKYDKVLVRADGFLKGIQWDESEDIDESSFSFGGAGYGKHRRPDLSNTNFFIEALRATGNDSDSEAIKRALIFVARCQNLESQYNQTPFGALINDGGSFYTPAAGGTSQAGKEANGGLRSYGSMTYAGLKSMIYAGVGPDDKRVKAAVGWIKRNYKLDSNPGMGSAGLYYYYHTFAKALDALGEDIVQDESGVEHNWRSELITELAKRQQKDGSWRNEDNERWLEGDNNLVTGYALITLSYCRPKKKK